MTTEIHQWVEECRAGRFSRLACRMKSGYLVFGDPQVLPGYCLLLPDPVVPHLNALAADRRAQFLVDMATAGDAILSATNAARINYEILGNLTPALHAHVIPRYDDETQLLKTKPIWSYDWSSAPRFAETALSGKIREAVAKL